MKRVYFLLMMAIVISLIGTACGGATPTAAPTVAPPVATKGTTVAPAGVKVLRIGRSTYPDVIDPQKSSYGIEIEVLKLAYEGLLAINEKGVIGPGGAEKWVSSPDGTQMTFTIRAGMKRFDGTPMTAKDYEYALKREVDPNVPGKQYTSILYDIKGAEDLDNFDTKKGTPAELEKLWANYGVKATDDKTLVVTFKSPIGFWQYVAYTWVTYPSDKKIVDKDPDNWWTKAAGHNGNGPFKIQSIEQGKKIVFVPNADYWRGKPKLDRIELIYNPDNAVIFQAYGKDELDIDANMIPEEIAVVQADAKLKADYLRLPAAITTGFAFNNTTKPFSDVNARKAFSAAFDRVGFIRDVVKGLGGAYTRWVPPGVPGAQDTKPGVPGYDAKAAVKFLTDNGYASAKSTADKPVVDCEKLGPIKLTYGASPINHSRNQFIAGSFAAVFGCPITLDPVDPTVATALSKDIKTQPQISRAGWIQDYPHPQNWLSVYWTCNAFALRYGYCNKAFDAMTAKADQELDFAKSLALYQQAEDILVQDVPSAFIYYQETIYMVKPWVLGPKDHTGSSDAEWAGEWGPVWEYDIDLTKVPANYPKQ
jgi:oligopeptide transport system substrate-binding protein